MTQVLPCTDDALDLAADLIRRGEIVGFPTETVYGLGADALNPRAVMKLFAAKGRPGDNPLIVHIANLNQLRPLIARAPSEAALMLAQRYWPGPLTMLFEKSERVPDCVTAGLPTVGVRMPANSYAQQLIARAARPIAAPSANRSGRPSPTTAQRVLEDMDGRIPLILDGGECAVGLESTVVDLTGGAPRILRPGGVTPEMIADAVGDVLVDARAMRPLAPGEQPRSPGMKYRHYAPNGALTIFTGDAQRVAARIRERYDACAGRALILAQTAHINWYAPRDVLPLGDGAEETAKRLFEALRQADDMNASCIFAEAVDPTGMGLAVMNRLGRASSFQIEEVI
ncbi:MAG: L-threonylcarbamoyladenylate synthase [Christensenellales bacterium]|jgi:L-threonylcarbamoyladenylate synthase